MASCIYQCCHLASQFADQVGPRKDWKGYRPPPMGIGNFGGEMGWSTVMYNCRGLFPNYFGISCYN